MSVGKILETFGAVGQILSKRGLLDANGNFVTPVSTVAVANVVADVEQLLKADGVTVQAEVDKFIAALPFILALAGVK